MDQQDLARAVKELQSILNRFTSDSLGDDSGAPRLVPRLRGGLPLVKFPKLPEKLTAGGSLPICVVCEDVNFNGAQWWWANGWDYVGDAWNDRISSIVVVSGQWTFYKDAHLQGDKWPLGPGWYPNVAAEGIPNDCISSAEITGF